MKLINDFLKEPLKIENSMEIKDVDTKDVDKLNGLFIGNSIYNGYIRLEPKIKENQIWTIKNQYLDYEGNIQKIPHPMMVIIVSGEDSLDEDTTFVRVCPISPFIERASSSDQICSDPSIVGFPFLIESWNGQPIMVEILDKYISDYFFEISNINNKLNQVLSEFRDIEISNAKYLNHSIMSYIAENERSNHFSFSVDLNYQNYSKTKHMPAIGIRNSEFVDLHGNEEYAAVAKMGNTITENDCIEFVEKSLPFQLEIRKKNGLFIVTVIPRIDISLFNDKNEEILGNDNRERIVYDNLTKGIYNIKTPLVKDSIIIRLK